MKGKQKYSVHLQSEIFNSFRTQMACNSLDIDITKKSTHKLDVNCNFPDDWNIGLIYGASGSGKTTLAKKVLGEDCFKTFLDESKPIIEQLPSSWSYDECASALAGIGLTSVPCWVRPVYTLSNGQKARAEAVLLMAKSEEQVTAIDEWTSVVDRTIGKVMSHCVQKFARKNKKQIVLLSCHYDVIEWLKPDWVIDCNKQEFMLPQSKDFFFQQREQLQFDIKPVDRSTWKYFSKYHYLSENLPGGKIYTFGLFHNGNQIGFQCFANYVPKRAGHVMQFHSNRTVIHPEYQGLGLGIMLINKTSEWMHENTDYKIMAKFSSVPIFKSMIKNPAWKFTGEKKLFGKMQKGGTMERQKGFRESGVKTFHFEYRGNIEN
jgi:energy-coupling factor transporter ATP-binding protein EcfA2